MNIKINDGLKFQRVFGDVTHYVVSGTPFESVPHAESTVAYLRMFRGTDVNTYGPFDFEIKEDTQVYVTNNDGKTVDSLFGTDFRKGLGKPASFDENGAVL
jgi:hypothetical protein